MRSDLLPDDTSADPGQYAAGDAPWDRYRVEMELRALRTRVEEAEAKSAIDQRQCDEMTDTAGRLAERVAALEQKLAAWEPVVREVTRLRARVAELERELETSRALATTNAHTHHEVRHLYAEMNRQGARLAAWEPVVSKACSLEGIEDDDLWERRCDEIEIAAADIPPEHRPEVTK